jgi:two-component system chemotaxis response regulator CheB
MEAKQIIEATCPDCRGPLTEFQHGELTEYRCLVGHAYSARGVLRAHSDAQEKALWAAVVALEESAQLVAAVALHLPGDVAQRIQAQAQAKLAQAAEIRNVIERLEPFHIE